MCYEDSSNAVLDLLKKISSDSAMLLIMVALSAFRMRNTLSTSVLLKPFGSNRCIRKFVYSTYCVVESRSIAESSFEKSSASISGCWLDPVFLASYALFCKPAVSVVDPFCLRSYLRRAISEELFLYFPFYTRGKQRKRRRGERAVQTIFL